MSFYAKSFSYGGESSEFYSLEIANIEGGSSSNPGSGQVDIIDQYIFRRPKSYFYGISYTSPLSFPVSFFSPNELTALDISYIQMWLFGGLEYKALAIVQPDMDEIYLNAIFTDPRIIRFGNNIYGISGTCTCDSQFAYTYPKTVVYDEFIREENQLPSKEITFYNNSHYQGYLYPTCEFIRNSQTSGGFSITNYSDDDRVFEFEDLLPYETITVNNDLGIIQSDSGLRRLSNFNKNFLRFVPGVNNLFLEGEVSEFTLTYQFLRRIGG
jgi:hypothetical protein